MPNYETVFWREKVFNYITAAVVLFVVFTIVAMFFYPGGTLSDPTTQGYSFFRNFFSDLGALHTTSGAPNYVSAVLFVAALSMAGLSLMFFGPAFLKFFNRPGAGRIPARCGLVFGIITGLCFIGVAFTPVDVFFNAHFQFSQWGFRFFLVAALFWAIAIFYNREYPRLYGWIFVVFDLLLLGFVLLRIFGPSSMEAVLGNAVMATGQKITVYAALITTLIQARGARAINKG